MKRFFVFVLILAGFSFRAQVSTSGCTLSGGMSIFSICTGTDPANGYSATTSGIGCTSGCNLTAYNAFGTMCNGSPFNGNCNNSGTGGHQVMFTHLSLPSGCMAAVTAEFKPRTGCTNSGLDSGDSLLISGSGGTSSSPNPNSSGGSANSSVALTFTQTGGTLNIRLRANRSEEIATWTINLTGSCGVNCSGVLPIELKEFTGEEEGSDILLKWNVASELNVLYYQVEKSTDGINFSPFQTVASIAGVSGEHNLSYFAKDFSPQKGLNYYKLLNVDKDGSTQSSRVISVAHDFSLVQDININVTESHVNFLLKDKQPAQTLYIRDLTGRLVKEIQISGSETILSLPKTDFISGLYFVSLGGYTSCTKKFVVN